MIYKIANGLLNSFAKIIRDQFFKCEARYDIGYCNYYLLFYVIFCNLFSILTHLYCLHGMFVKIKTFYIKVFLLGICVFRPPAPAPICIWRPQPSICIYRPRPSLCVRLFFVLQLKFVIATCLLIEIQRLIICTKLLSKMWAISKLQLFEISPQEAFSIFFSLSITDHIPFIFIS